MTQPTSRQYHSPIREQKANTTRLNIIKATERLLPSKGYAKMTVEAIAHEAKVSTQTIYAVFGSKRGIIAAILDHAVMTQNVFELHQSSLETASIDQALRITARLIRQVYEQERPIYGLLRGAGALDPELALIENKRECCQREEANEHIRQILEKAAPGTLKDNLTISMAQDMFLCLGGRDVYRIMVQERGWSDEAYVNWLYEMLRASILKSEFCLSSSERPPESRETFPA